MWGFSTDTFGEISTDTYSVQSLAVHIPCLPSPTRRPDALSNSSPRLQKIPMAAYCHSLRFQYFKRTAAMLIFSYTGAQRHKLPTGHPSQQTIGAHILPRCSRHRRPLVLPIVRPIRSRLNRMFDNILRGLVVEFRTQHSALRYASGGMLGQSEDFQIYSYKWYRRPYMCVVFA